MRKNKKERKHENIEKGRKKQTIGGSFVAPKKSKHVIFP